LDLGISEKVALVTGAGRGIGRAIARQLAREGTIVAAVSRSLQPLESLQAELRPNGDRHRILALDLTTAGAAGEVVDWVTRELGLPDIIVHNVGGSLGISDPLAPSQDWERVWRFNLGVPLDINRALIPALTERRWGRIVHVSTNATITFQAYAAYVSAKSALNAYVKIVGRSVAKSNVVISAVLPGALRVEGRYLARLEAENGDAWAEYVRNHLAIGRLAGDDEIASAVVFLCSSGASYCAGAFLPVDGAII